MSSRLGLYRARYARPCVVANGKRAAPRPVGRRAAEPERSA